MLKINLALWIVSLASQALLLTALVSRGVMRRLPVFCALLCFYILRSLALHSLASSVSASAYTLTLGGLALVDTVLQVAVAWELFSALSLAAAQPIDSGGSTQKSSIMLLMHGSLLRRFAAFAVLILASAALASFCVIFVQASPRAPMDRSVLFTSFFFILIWFACRAFAYLALRARPLISRVALGFSLYAIASIVSQIERARAVLHRDTYGFTFWSYAQPLAYLALIFLWILFLPADREDPSALTSDLKRRVKRPPIASVSEGPMPLVR